MRNEGGRGLITLPMPVPEVPMRGRSIVYGVKNRRALAKYMREIARESAESSVADALQRVAIKPAEAVEETPIQSETGQTQDPIDASMAADVLIDATVSCIRGSKVAMETAWKPYAVIIAGIIGYLYLTWMALKDDAPALAVLLSETGVKGSRRGKPTSHHTLATRALLIMADWVPPDGSADDYSERVRALEVAGVALDVDEVQRWFTEKVMIDGKRVSGVRRARAVLKQNRAGGGEKQERDDNDALEQGVASTILLQATGDPLGVIDPHEDKQLPEGHWVAWMDGNVALMRLPMTEKEIRKKVLKNGARP